MLLLMYKLWPALLPSFSAATKLQSKMLQKRILLHRSYNSLLAVLSLCMLRHGLSHAEIAAVEAYQAGIVRSFLFQANEGSNSDWPYQPTIATVVGDIAKLRASASNDADDVGIVNGTAATLVPVDDQSLVFTRTPTQVRSAAPS